MSRTVRKGPTQDGLGSFKKKRRKRRRAKERDAMKSGKYEDVPKFKKSDKWDFL